MGNFRLEKIPPNKAGVPKIQVTFEVDVNGILHVSALEMSTNAQNHIEIKSESGRLTKEKIEVLVAEAEAMKEQDQARVDQVEAQTNLEQFLYQVKQSLVSQETLEKISTSDLEKMESQVEETQNWLTSETTMQDCQTRKQELEISLGSVLGKLYQQTGVVPGQDDSKLTTEEVNEVQFTPLE